MDLDFNSPVIVGARGRVEWWPEHPQENGTNHGEQVGVIFSTLNILLVFKSRSYHKFWTIKTMIRCTNLRRGYPFELLACRDILQQPNQNNNRKHGRPLSLPYQILQVWRRECKHLPKNIYVFIHIIIISSIMLNKRGPKSP